MKLNFEHFVSSGLELCLTLFKSKFIRRGSAFQFYCLLNYEMYMLLGASFVSNNFFYYFETYKFTFLGWLISAISCLSVFAPKCEDTITRTHVKMLIYRSCVRLRLLRAKTRKHDKVWTK